MKKIVIALLAALMVSSTFLTACGCEAPSSVSDQAKMSADALMREIVANFPASSDITIASTYDEEYSSTSIFSDDMYVVGSIATDGNNVIFRVDLFNDSLSAEEAANVLAYGMAAVIDTMTPSISEREVKEIEDGLLQTFKGLGSYSKRVGDITYIVSMSDDGEYINFMAS